MSRSSKSRTSSTRFLMALRMALFRPPPTLYLLAVRLIVWTARVRGHSSDIIVRSNHFGSRTCLGSHSCPLCVNACGHNGKGSVATMAVRAGGVSVSSAAATVRQVKFHHAMFKSTRLVLFEGWVIWLLSTESGIAHCSAFSAFFTGFLCPHPCWFLMPSGRTR